MMKEITRLILGIIIVGGAVYSALFHPSALEYLIGLAGFVIGYYFKDSVNSIGAIFSRK